MGPPWAHLNGISENSMKSHFNFQEQSVCRNWIRHRMTQNSNRNHRIGPVGTLARGAESAVHESTGSEGGALQFSVSFTVLDLLHSTPNEATVRAARDGDGNAQQGGR
eukprot:COSAG02_NODE_5454_length_4303_cov_5.503330_7_plen_108_part_00